MTNQSKFSAIVGLVDATLALWFGVSFGTSILLGVFAFGASMGLFFLDSIGKLFKE